MRTAALWLTIGTLVAAAVLGGVFIIVGDQANIAGRAWLTLLLVVAFAGVVLLDGSNSDGPNHWYLPASTLLDVFLVAIGLLKLWNGPLQPADTASGSVWSGQLALWVGAVAVVRIALLITQLYWLYVVARAKLPATRVTGMLTVALVWLTALVFVIPLSFPNLRPIGLSGYADWWWRIAGATALVMAVSVVIPLVVRAFEPRPPRSASPPYPPQPPAGVPQQRPAYGQPPRYGERASYGQQPYGQSYAPPTAAPYPQPTLNEQPPVQPPSPEPPQQPPAPQ
ncbi:MAG TPA: hypothetical protein VGC45_08745 [Gryllotalpicola sp.]